jgi:hypothetical protein
MIKCKWFVNRFDVCLVWCTDLYRVDSSSAFAPIKIVARLTEDNFDFKLVKSLNLTVLCYEVLSVLLIIQKPVTWSNFYWKI